MAEHSPIEWTDATWNPVRGCDKVSPGCKNCYAERLAERFRGVVGHPYEQGFDLRLVPEEMSAPFLWTKPGRCFVNSMSDLFHEDIPDEYIADLVKIMIEAPWHTYQILTKRHERMAHLLATKLSFAAGYSHIWWGVSCENKKHGLPRIATLRAISAARRFVSIEPLLEDLGDFDMTGIDWAIVGGESGPKSRPMDPEWVDNAQRICDRDGVIFFFKQWGGANKKATGRTLHGRTWDDMPPIFDEPMPIRGIRKERAAFWEQRAERWIEEVPATPLVQIQVPPAAADDPPLTPSTGRRVFSIDKQEDKKIASPPPEPPPSPPPDAGATLDRIIAYLRDYLSFPDPQAFLVLALYAILMHCWNQCFDEVPYLCVSAATKRAGKTRVLELLLWLSGDQRAIMLTGDVTAPALFEEISLHHRTLLIDEAEKMQKRHSPLREILNSGYRRGSSVLRKGVRYDIYSPKVLALIGDLEDSLRDRCIIIEMTRIKQGAARRRLVQAIAIEEGHDIELAIAAVVEARLEEIRSVYLTYDDQSLAFLPDRDKEIWTPMFSICSVFAPERIAGLKRTAIDIATLKTWKVRRSVDLEKEGERASHLEYGEQLIHDCLKVLAERDRIPTAELVEALWAEDEYPWRKYEGGVTAEKLSSMLKPFGVAPKTIRVGPKGPTGSTLKGYYRADFLKMKKPT